MPGSSQQQLFPELDDEEKAVADCLKENNGEESFDYLLNKTGFSFSKLSALLLNMEFKGVVSTLPGNRYRLIALV